MEEYIGIQQKLLQGISVLVDDVQTELLQQVADLADVIRIGIEFELLILRESSSDRAASKKHDKYRCHFLLVHLRFSFHILIPVRVTKALASNAPEPARNARALGHL
jgi:hypothetical protein